MFVKCSVAFEKRRGRAFSCLTRHRPRFTTPSQEAREIRCLGSGPPYLPGATQTDAAHLCCFRASSSEVMVLEIAQGAGGSGRPFFSTLPRGFSHGVLGSWPCVGFIRHARVWVTHALVTKFTCSTGECVFLREEHAL